jgi:hypothetical protein
MAIWTPSEIPWALIATPFAAAEDAVARLDERLSRSPIRDGWIARTHFTDACDSLWLAGELVHVEDLVLHNERMDVRTPTHEITRAHAVLRARRRILENAPDWALSQEGLDVLRGRSAAEQGRGDGYPDNDDADLLQTEDRDDLDLAEEFAALDAAITRSQQLLSGARPRDPVVYDPDWGEDEKLGEWRDAVRRTNDLPPVLAAAIALEAWDSIEPLQNSPWLGRLLVSALLRSRAKARNHLPCLNTGLRALPSERRRARDRSARVVAFIEAFSAAVVKGLEDHDRWALARRQLERKLVNRRSTSKLPALIDYVMSRPIVSAGMVAKELSVTARGAQDLVAELGLREATGKRRYRVWGVL